MKWFNSFGKSDIIVRRRQISGDVTLDKLRVLVEETKDWPGDVKVLDSRGQTSRNIEVILQEHVSE